MYCPDPLLPRDSPPHRAAAAALQAAGGQGRRVRHVLAGVLTPTPRVCATHTHTTARSSALLGKIDHNCILHI